MKIEAVQAILMHEFIGLWLLYFTTTSILIIFYVANFLLSILICTETWFSTQILCQQAGYVWYAGRDRTMWDSLFLSQVWRDISVGQGGTKFSKNCPTLDPRPSCPLTWDKCWKDDFTLFISKNYKLYIYKTWVLSHSLSLSFVLPLPPLNLISISISKNHQNPPFYL